MDLGFSDLQIELAQVLREILNREFDAKRLRRVVAGDRALVRSLWRTLAEQGYIGALIPQEYGGIGLDLVDIALLLQELGRSLAPGPVVETVALAVPLILSQGTDRQKEQLLPAIANGDMVITSAVDTLEAGEGTASIGIIASPAGNLFRLNGEKRWVVDLDVADHLLVAARHEQSEGVSLFLVPVAAPGIHVEILPGMDRTRQFAHVQFDGVQVSSDQLLGRVGGGGKALATALLIATAAHCCSMVGGSEKVLEVTVDYVQMRQQFGTIIGKFQAVKHKCADMLLHVESAKSATYYAAWAAASGDESALSAVAVAKNHTSQAYSKVASDSIQLHGGIGFTWEHDAHLYLKRAKTNEIQFGSPRRHRERITAVMGW